MKLLRKNKKQIPDERRRPSPGNNPAVFSYYARGSSASDNNVGRGDERGEKRIRSEDRRFTLGNLPSYLAFMAIIVALVYAMLLQPSPRVVLLNSPGTIHREALAYEEAVQVIWKQSLLNRTKLTVPTGKISQKIQEQFNELAYVNIQLPLLGSRAVIVLTPAKPTLQLISGNGSFYVALNGEVMTRITDVSQNELGEIPMVLDESGIPAEPGKSILSAPETSYIDKLYKQLKAANLEILSITLPKSAAKQADVRLAGQEYFIKFSLDSDPRQAVGAYLAASKKLQASNIIPKEYMDVRVEEKIFYK